MLVGIAMHLPCTLDSCKSDIGVLNSVSYREVELLVTTCSMLVRMCS